MKQQSVLVAVALVIALGLCVVVIGAFEQKVCDQRLSSRIKEKADIVCIA